MAPAGATCWYSVGGLNHPDTQHNLISDNKTPRGLPRGQLALWCPGYGTAWIVSARVRGLRALTSFDGSDSRVSLYAVTVKNDSTPPGTSTVYVVTFPTSMTVVCDPDSGPYLSRYPSTGSSGGLASHASLTVFWTFWFGILTTVCPKAAMTPITNTAAAIHLIFRVTRIAFTIGRDSELVRDEYLRAVEHGRYIRPSAVVEASWLRKVTNYDGGYSRAEWFLRLETPGRVYFVGCRAEQNGWIEALGIPDLRT